MKRLIALFCVLVNSPKVLAAAVLGSWVTLSGAYSLIEHKGPIEGLWWGVVTGSTVGYGDTYPQSTPGRFIGFLTIITGVVLTAAVVGQLIGLTDRNAWTHEEQEEVKRKIDELYELAKEQREQDERRSPGGCAHCGRGSERISLW